MKAKIDEKCVHTADPMPELGYSGPVWIDDETGHILGDMGTSFLYPQGHMHEFDITDGQHVGTFLKMMRQVRTMMTLSQKGLADKSGLSIGTVQNIESNIGSPSLATIGKMLDALGMRLILANKE